MHAGMCPPFSTQPCSICPVQYFGEMLVWWGVLLGCCRTFEGGEWAAVASPLFVMFLLLGVSGVPLQERQAKERWGQDPAYLTHRANTFLLLPLPRPQCGAPTIT